MRSKLLRRLTKLATIAIVLMLAGTVFYLGIYSERTGFVKEVLDPKLKQITLPVLNAFRSQKSSAELLHVSIAPADLDSIRAIRERALELGVLKEGKDRWFKISLVWKGDSLSGKMRLKGGLSDHFATEKWSYRIKLDSGLSIMDCSVFSVQHPNTRNFNYEWLLHQALKQEGLPAIHYDFVAVELNGENLGLHAFEENFSHNWTSKHGSIRGPVMKFDDENRIQAIQENPDAANDPSLHPLASWFASPIDAFQLKKVRKDSLNAVSFQENVLILEAFRKGELPASEVFVIEQLARFFAITDLLGAQHAQDWRNIRFAQSAYSKKLIPIGFDGNAGEAILKLRVFREQRPIDLQVRPEDNFYEKLFNDTVFYARYINMIDAYLGSDWVKGLLQNHKEGVERTESLINLEFPRFKLEEHVFQQAVERSEQSLRPKTVLDVYSGEDGRSIQVGNLCALPVVLHSIIIDGDTVQLDNELVVAVASDGPMFYQQIQLPIKITKKEKVRLTFSLYLFENAEEHSLTIKAWKNSL